MRFAIALLLCLTLPAHADGFLTRLLNKPVPGGVAVIDLGNDATAPKARYEGKPVLVVREDDQRWIAIVGIPLTVKAGQQSLEVAGQAHEFRVEPRTYHEQHITLKNQRQVTPNPADLKRIERELDEQTRAYRQFSARQPSNLLLDKPVNGPCPRHSGCDDFSTVKNATRIPGWISQHPPVHRSRRPLRAQSSLRAITSSTARRYLLTTAKG